MNSVSLSPEVLFSISGFSVTNAMIYQWLISLVLMIGLPILVRRWQKIPKKPQVALEMVAEFVLSNVSLATNNKAKTKKIFPLIATLFFYILFCNLFSLMPALGAFSLHRQDNNVPLFRAALADYGQVLVMTLIVVGLAQFLFIAYQGIKPYLKQWFDFSSPIAFVLGIMNIIGELAKVLSLSFRLFGNLFAGEVLTAVLMFLCPFFLPIPFTFLSLMTCVIQAFVFSLLSAIYLGQAMGIGVEEMEVKKLEIKN
jgi:F-type H+-transporting ATPase subunit a